MSVQPLARAHEDVPAVVLLTMPTQARQYLLRAVRREVALLRRDGAAVPTELMAFLRQIGSMNGQDRSCATQAQDTEHVDVMPPLLVTRPEAARLLGLSESTVQRLVRTQQLRPVYVGGNTRFRVRDLNLYVDSLPGPTTIHEGKVRT